MFSAYIFRIVTAASASAVAVRMIPANASRGVRRAAAFSLTLVMAALMLAPVIPALEDFGARAAAGEFAISPPPSGAAEREALLRAVEDETREEIGHRLASLVCAAFSLPEGSVTAEVKIRFAETGVALEKIYVILSGHAIFADPRAVEKYLADVSGCDEIEILY